MILEELPRRCSPSVAFLESCSIVVCHPPINQPSTILFPPQVRELEAALLQTQREAAEAASAAKQEPQETRSERALAEAAATAEEARLSGIVKERGARLEELQKQLEFKDRLLTQKEELLKEMMDSSRVRPHGAP